MYNTYIVQGTDITQYLVLGTNITNHVVLGIDINHYLVLRKTHFDLLRTRLYEHDFDVT